MISIPSSSKPSRRKGYRKAYITVAVTIRAYAIPANPRHYKIIPTIMLPLLTSRRFSE